MPAQFVISKCMFKNKDVFDTYLKLKSTFPRVLACQLHLIRPFGYPESFFGHDYIIIIVATILIIMIIIIIIILAIIIITCRLSFIIHHASFIIIIMITIIMIIITHHSPFIIHRSLRVKNIRIQHGEASSSSSSFAIITVTN